MIRSIFIAALALLFLAGCNQTVPYIPSDALTDTNSAKIHVYRIERSVPLGLAVDTRITMDGSYIGSLPDGAAIVLRVPPGPHTFKAQGYTLGIPDPHSVSLGMSLEAGQSYYLRYGEGYSQFPFVEISLASVSRSDWEQKR